MLFPRVVPAFLLALPLLASAGDAGCTTGELNCCQQVESVSAFAICPTQRYSLLLDRL